MPRPSVRWHSYLRFWRSDVAGDIDEELRFHLESRIQELTDAGVPVDAARLQAEREMGDARRAREVVREMDTRHARRRGLVTALGAAWRDARFAARTLAKAPGFTSIVIITLALGIGLNSAVFSVASAFLFRPLPVPRGGEIVVLGQTDPSLSAPHEMSYPNYRDFAADTTLFRGLAGFSNSTYTVQSLDGSGTGRAERAWFDEVTANYFDVLGLRPHLGRFFRADEDQGSLAHPVIVLSWSFWQRRFGGDSAIVGDTLRVAGRPMTVIGVAPEGFRGVSSILTVDAFAPVDQVWPGYGNTLRNRPDGFLNVFGRLQPGISMSSAASAVHAIARRLERDYPIDNKGFDVVIARETRSRPALAISANVPIIVAAFMTLVALVLLIACANVASLFLVRAAARRRELSIRAALGAGRWRLARQVVVECLLLALGGALGALLLARAAMHALTSIHVAADVPLAWGIEPDWRVFAYTLAISVAAALLAALVPALQSARTDLAESLKAGARGVSAGQQRLRRVLVVGQVAVSLAVLVSAALFAKSAGNALRMDLGFRSDHLMMTSMRLPRERYDETKRRAFYADVLERVASLPGVRAVSTAEHTPLGYNNETEQVFPEATTAPDAEQGVRFFFNTVSPGFFRAIGTPLLAGRDFSASDDSTAPRVAIVSRAFADRFWAGQSAIGRRFRFAKEGPTLAIVGVAKDAQYMDLGEAPRPFIYLPTTQGSPTRLTLFVHTAGEPETYARPLRDAVAALDPELSLYDVRSMDEHLLNGRALLFVRIGAGAASAFGLLALVLAAVGVYGVISYSVTQRTKEIGIRVALGARLAEVLTLVLREGAVIAVTGVGLGLVAAFALATQLGGLLYGVGATDPVIFGSVSVVLIAVALAASYLPARRAGRVDPLEALRAE